MSPSATAVPETDSGTVKTASMTTGITRRRPGGPVAGAGRVVSEVIEVIVLLYPTSVRGSRRNSNGKRPFHAGRHRGRRGTAVRGTGTVAPPRRDATAPVVSGRP